MNMKFPDSTYFNRKLPKQRFYENLTVSAATKKSFVDQIKSIYWENKISADTINIAAENTITEIEIFRINLNQDTIDESVLRLLDKGIPYPIIFILQYNRQFSATTDNRLSAGNRDPASHFSQFFHYLKAFFKNPFFDPAFSRNCKKHRHQN